ncbi:MAG TPA: phosphate signaling complex protein PhoU [Actinomycetota bacterium]|jgi:phosphate transport system protein|nr:phosphate signaling complex protein PhoU [Actinomycetota bacterium]
MTRASFHEELESTELELLSLGELAATAVQRSTEALVQHDDEKARAVIDSDDPIDELYLKIDGGVLRMLALQSPVAEDLRLISAILHCNLHLERVGDQAVNVAKLYLATKDARGSESMRRQLEEMSNLVVRMLRTAMEAFGRRDLELALRVPAMDDPVDRLNRMTHLEALKLADDPSQLDWGLHMNMAARALERVGDNAVDIAEQVGFLLTGEFREFTDASHPVVLE